MNLHDWIDELCDMLELDDVEVDEGLLVDLAQTATRRVHPSAAAVTTYLLGLAAARRGAGLADVEDLADQVEKLAGSWNRPAGGAVAADDPPADEGGSDYTDALDLGAGDSDDVDDHTDRSGSEDHDLAEVG